MTLFDTDLLMFVFTIGATVGGITVAAVKYVDAKLDPLIRELGENTRETRAIRVELFGVSGNNGIRSEIRELKADVKNVTHRVWDIEHTAKSDGES